MRRRVGSLFWTFAGAFLVVVVVATILQAVAIHAFFSPSFRNWLTGEARNRAALVARDIEALGDNPSPGDIRVVLRRRADDRARTAVVFRFSDGELITTRPLPPFARRRLGMSLGQPERRNRPPPAGRGRPVHVLARESVERGGTTLGEVVVLAWQPRVPLLPIGMPLRIVVILPIAMLVAALAGLVLFRVLIRRIRKLESLAMRVAEGDLSARVERPGPDEIGRLGTQLNRMAENLAMAAGRVEAGERQRRQLLADVSHELATPLTSIRGYTETLLNPAVSLSEEEQRQYLEDVVNETKRIEALVQDLFDLTRLEASAVTLDREPIDLSALCRRTVERYRHRFVDAGIEIEVNTEIDEAWVDADGRRLEQVLDNLVTNALRYVPSGGHVWLDLARSGKSGRLRLRVSDDGPGFEVDELRHVFDRFYRADASRSTPGTGLGLAIVKEIIERHDGRVWAERREPTGAIVVVELPAREGPS